MENFDKLRERLEAAAATRSVSADLLREFCIASIPEGLTLSYDLQRRVENHGWTIGPAIENRDSDLLAESNADAIGKMLAEVDPSNLSYSIERFNHWGAGWIDTIVFKALAKDGSLSPVYRCLQKIKSALENYPVLDEEDYSRREYEATLEDIESKGHTALSDTNLGTNDLPDDWVKTIFSWLWDNEQEEVEPIDGGGGRPSVESIRRALVGTGLVPAETFSAEEEGEA